MSPHPRRPIAVALDDPDLVVAPADAEIAPDAILARAETQSGALAVADRKAPAVPRKRFRWPALFWSAFGALATMGAGLAVTVLIEDLFARSAILGWLGAALSAVAAVALVAIVAREAFGLIRLAAIEDLRDHAVAVVAGNKRGEGVAIARRLLHLTRNAPALARARRTVETHLDDIIESADMVRLAERNLLAPLDQEARRLVSAAATRVSIVTAVSPRAMIDMLFVLATTFGLVRRLAYLYGGRPGTLGLLRLMRLCVAHLTVTGGLAMGDSIVQQALGHGLVAKLSSRLGEGMLNGLLTARLGLAAIDVTRPLPFVAVRQPTLSELASDLLRQRDKAD